MSYFLGSAGVIYGILLGLVAAGAWSNFQSLSNQVDEEATITAALYQDMATYPLNYRQAYQQELKQYVKSIIHQDWPAHHRGQVPQESSKILRSFKNHLFAFIPTTPRPFRGGFSVDASAFESVLYEMVTY